MRLLASLETPHPNRARWYFAVFESEQSSIACIREDKPKPEVTWRVPEFSESEKSTLPGTFSTQEKRT